MMATIPNTEGFNDEFHQKCIDNNYWVMYIRCTDLNRVLAVIEELEGIDEIRKDLYHTIDKDVVKLFGTSVRLKSSYQYILKKLGNDIKKNPVLRYHPYNNPFYTKNYYPWFKYTPGENIPLAQDIVKKYRKADLLYRIETGDLYMTAYKLTCLH
jgi:hypothetical protein